MLYACTDCRRGSLSQKFDFQPSTTKPGNIDHPTVKKPGQSGPLDGFEGGFILWELKIFKFKLKNS